MGNAQFYWIRFSRSSVPCFFQKTQTHRVSYCFFLQSKLPGSCRPDLCSSSRYKLPVIVIKDSACQVFLFHPVVLKILPQEQRTCWNTQKQIWNQTPPPG